MKTKTILDGTVLALIVSIGLLTSCSKESVANKLLDKIVMEGNKLCPVDVDYMTRYDSIARPESLTLAYYYTVAATKVELDSMQMNWSQMRDVLLSNVKSNPQIASLLALDVKFTYIYFDSEGLEIYKTAILPEDYKKQ